MKWSYEHAEQGRPREMTRRPRIAINGAGRIGRAVTRAALTRTEEVDLVAINDPAVDEDLPWVIEHDSVYGLFPVAIRATEVCLT